jgi:NADP-dependent 3-hydroxy acid dehydrogenase YdfG
MPVSLSAARSPSGAPLAGMSGVVTGAGGQIGRAIALALAGVGARICLVGRTLETLEAVAASVPADAPSPLVHRGDLTVDSTIQGLAERLRGDFERLDLLVHCAGVFFRGSLATAPIRELDDQYRTNVRAPYLLTQALLPQLTASQGQVVFINSSVGLEARASVGQFAATQHAFRAIADSLRAEVNALGVRVLNIFLGRTASHRMVRIFELEGQPYHPELLIQPMDVALIVLAALSLPRTAEVTDIRIRPMTKSY